MSVRSQFLLQHGFSTMVVRPLVAGRVVQLVAYSPLGTIVITNLHLDPNLSIPEANAVLGLVHHAAPCGREVLAFVIGDYNSHIAEEGRFSSGNKRATYQPSRYAHVFDQHLGHMIDIGGDYYTH